MLRLLLIPCFLAALLAGAVVWSGGGGQQQRADFAFINRGDNKCMDPNNMSWMQDIRLAYALWEGLYTLDPVTLKPILGTADRANVDSTTHTIWTIHIRPDARWSNGDPVLARDYLFSWRRFLETPGEYSSLHFYIRGAKDYSDRYQDYVDARSRGQNATPPSFAPVGEEMLDDRTLRITLSDPVPFFPALMAFPPFFPMHEPSMRPFATTDPITGVTTYDLKFTSTPFDPAHPERGGLVTNGPYRLAEWLFKRRVRVVASDYYWDRANVKSKVIDEVSADNGLAAFRAYDRGEVDWLSDTDYDISAEILKQHSRTDLHVFPAYGTYFYSLNCLPKLPGDRPNPLADRRVRRALSMAIDKRIVVADAGRMNQLVTTDYLPINTFEGYHSPPGLPFDPVEAKKELADAGYPNGQGFPSLTILYNNELNHGDVAQVVRRQWLNNLNIQVNLEGVEVKIAGDRLHTQQYDIARASWFGDYNDPSTFTDIFKTDSSDNNPKWSNPKYDQLCAQAAKESNVQHRLDLISQAENVLLEDAPIIPIYYYTNNYMFRDNVKGLPLTASAMQMFKSIEVVHLNGPIHRLANCRVPAGPGGDLFDHVYARLGDPRKSLRKHRAQTRSGGGESPPHAVPCRFRREISRILSPADSPPRRSWPQPFVSGIFRQRHPARGPARLDHAGPLCDSDRDGRRLRRRRDGGPPPKWPGRCRQSGHGSGRHQPPEFCRRGFASGDFLGSFALVSQRRVGHSSADDPPGHRTGDNADGVHYPPDARLHARHAQR
jgi:oligopeptide transport system substrate-binding protein